MFKKIIAFFKRIMPSKRKLIQLYAALLTNANMAGFVTGTIYKGNTKSICVPGMNCYSCPGAVGACPLGSLQNALSESKTKAPHYVIGIILLYCILLGRTICGFLCPAGFLQELLYKIRTPKLKKNKVTRVLSYFKYVLLVVLVIAIPLHFGLQSQTISIPAFCKYICPVGTFEGAVGLLVNPSNTALFDMLGYIFTWKFAILAVTIVASIFIFRFFCRFLCPLGALYGIFNRFAILGIKVDKSKCDSCGACISHCKMDVKRVGDHECINCGECKDVCHTGAISWKMVRERIKEEMSEESGQTLVIASKEVDTNSNNLEENASVTLTNSKEESLKATEVYEIENKEKPKKKINTRTVTGIITTVVALGVLIFMFVYSALSGASIDVEKAAVVGEKIYSVELDVINTDGETYTIAENDGKITVINFWATWCGPCVAELPHFNEVQEEYMDDVTILAIHEAQSYDSTVDDYVLGNWGDYSITFLADDIDSPYYNALGGTDIWPTTYIVDQEGIVRYIHKGSLSKTVLASEIESLLG